MNDWQEDEFIPKKKKNIKNADYLIKEDDSIDIKSDNHESSDVLDNNSIETSIDYNPFVIDNQIENNEFAVEKKKNITDNVIDEKEKEPNNTLDNAINIENNFDTSSPIIDNVVVDSKNKDLDNQSKKRKFILSDKLLITLFVLAFIAVCSVVVKAFYLGKKVENYEDSIVTIEKKADMDAKVYSSQELDNKILKKVAASELTNCINQKIDMDNLSDGIKNVINEINSYYNKSNNYFSFAYKDIYTGFTVSYNANQNIQTASTIKAPTDIYIYEMASLGKIDLEKELTYTPKQYVVGSGSIQYQEMYTKYKTRDLLRYSTVNSDNIAHNILMDNYGRLNMLKFWSNLGTTAIFKQNSNWGQLNAHDALIYMSELYRFYVENDEYGNALMNNFMKASPKFIKGKNNYTVANKSGWYGSAVHDVSIIFADNPYIIVALSNTANENYTNYFNTANDLAYKLHTEYWKYKMSLCENIKQY